MRMTAFRNQMAGEFGPARAGMLAETHVFAELGDRTVEQALTEGYDAKRIWRVICETFAIPPERR